MLTDACTRLSRATVAGGTQSRSVKGYPGTEETESTKYLIRPSLNEPLWFCQISNGHNFWRDLELSGKNSYGNVKVKLISSTSRTTLPHEFCSESSIVKSYDHLKFWVKLAHFFLAKLARFFWAKLAHYFWAKLAHFFWANSLNIQNGYLVLCKICIDD